MKKIFYYSLAGFIAFGGLFAIARAEDNQNDSLIQIIVSKPQTVFRGSITALENRKDNIRKQIISLQIQLDNLSQPYEVVSKK